MNAKLLLSVACLASISGPVSSADKPDTQSINGVWVVEKATFYGLDITDSKAKYVFTVKDGAYTVDDGGPQSKGALKIDASKSPKQLDLLTDGVATLCIYELKDGKLTVCYGYGSDAKRPTEFLGKKDLLMVYKPTK